MPGGNQRKKETDAKKKKKKNPAGFCLFYLPVLFFFILCIRSHVTLRTGQNMCVHLQAAFSLS